MLHKSSVDDREQASRLQKSSELLSLQPLHGDIKGFLGRIDRLVAEVTSINDTLKKIDDEIKPILKQKKQLGDLLKAKTDGKQPADRCGQ